MMLSKTRLAHILLLILTAATKGIAATGTCTGTITISCGNAVDCSLTTCATSAESCFDLAASTSSTMDILCYYQGSATSTSADASCDSTSDAVELACDLFFSTEADCTSYESDGCAWEADSSGDDSDSSGDDSATNGGDSASNGGDSSSCFHADSLILTPTGLIRLADIKYGDVVVNHWGGVETVVAIAHAGPLSSRPAVAFVELKTAANTSLTYTPNHPVQDGNGNMLSITDPTWDGTLTLADSEVTKVVSVERKIVTDYRNLYTDGTNALVINGIRVSTLFGDQAVKNTVVRFLAASNKLAVDWLGVDLFELDDAYIPSAYTMASITFLGAVDRAFKAVK